MSKDEEPLLFRYQLGALRPVTGAAERALQQLDPGQIVRIEIKQMRGNVKRMAWYWVMLKIACEQFSDAVEGILTTAAMHRWFKRQTGLAKPIVSKKTGEVIDYDYESISFAKMPEHERAEYIDQTSELLSRRLGVDVETLRRESEEQAA